MSALSELKTTDYFPEKIKKPETDLPLKITGNAIDLEVNLAELDEHNRFSKSYEEECFAKVTETLEPNEVAYGAHFLNSAFTSMREEHVSVPDGLICEIDTSQKALDPSGVPIDAPVLKVKKIIEVRTGRINGNMKLAGFKNLTELIRKNPESFTQAFDNILKGRGGVANPTLIVAPEDSEIDVDFYSPRTQSEGEDEMRQRHLHEHPFKKVDYKTVPLQVFPMAA